MSIWGAYIILTSCPISGSRCCSFHELGVEAQAQNTCTAPSRSRSQLRTTASLELRAGTSSEPPDSMPSRRYRPAWRS